MLVYGPKRPFLLRYVSRNTRRTNFPRVDRLSTDTPDLGRHNPSKANVVADALSQKSRGVQASVVSRELQMLETMEQFRLHYSDQA